MLPETLRHRIAPPQDHKGYVLVGEIFPPDRKTQGVLLRSSDTPRTGQLLITEPNREVTTKPVGIFEGKRGGLFVVSDDKLILQIEGSKNNDARRAESSWFGKDVVVMCGSGRTEQDTTGLQSPSEGRVIGGRGWEVSRGDSDVATRATGELDFMFHVTDSLAPFAKAVRSPLISTPYDVESTTFKLTDEFKSKFPLTTALCLQTTDNPTQVALNRIGPKNGVIPDHTDGNNGVLTAHSMSGTAITELKDPETGEVYKFLMEPGDRMTLNNTGEFQAHHLVHNPGDVPRLSIVVMQ